MMKPRKMSFPDIGHKAAISTVPGFDLLNGKQKEKPFVQEIMIKILCQIRDFNYRPDHILNISGNGTTKALKFIIFSTSTLFFSKIVNIHNAAENNGYAIISGSLYKNHAKFKGLQKMIIDCQGINGRLNQEFMKIKSTTANRLKTKITGENIFYKNAYSIKQK